MTTLPRYPRDIEQAVQAEVCPRLLAAAEAVQRAIAQQQQPRKA